MKVPVAQKPRFKRGNLAAATAAMQQGDMVEVIKRLNEHAFNRQKTVAKGGKK